jgi:phosphonoacetaldehyde hydrolase
MADIRLAVFDWAGTTIDYGCLAPFGAFVQVFANRGVTVTAAEARAPMGLHKKDHLREMLRKPELAASWEQATGKPWSESDVESLYAEVTPAQLAAINDHAELVPGTLETMAALRSRGIRIGGTTGYFQAAADRCYTAAEKQGYKPDFCVCADEVAAGRPAPWMVFRVMERAGVYPASSVVKIGDTVADIEEGLNAGVWSVGVIDSGNEIGLARVEFDTLDEAERERLRYSARRKLTDAGAHAVVNTIAHVPALIEAIEERMEAGERP